jgi:cytochrome bd ubiquinol oxidase subunit II
MMVPFFNYPALTILAFISLTAILAVPHFVKERQDGRAFAASCFSIFFLMVLFVIGTFPNFAYSTINPDTNSLTYMNTSASELALFVLVIVTAAGIPLSFFYVPYVFKVFKGKVKIDPHSY